MTKKFIFTCILASLFSLCASAQLLYKIEGNGLEEPSYIFGTHHLAPASVLDKYPSLSKVKQDAKAVVGEIDMTVPQMQLAMSMQQYMMAPADSTIQALLTPEQLDSLDNKFKPYAPAPGMGLKQLGMMRPMVLATMVTMAELQKSLPGFDPANQLDTKFQTEFKEAGKSVIPLETPEQQAKLLYTFIPIEKQLADFRELLDDPSDLAEKCKALNEAYVSGNLDDLLKLTESDDSDPAFMEALTTLRNQTWLKKLPEIMKTQPALIVVGALHLAGPDGLITGLQNQGYNVTPLN